MAQRAIRREQKLHRVIARHGFCAEAISRSQLLIQVFPPAIHRVDQINLLLP